MSSGTYPPLSLQKLLQQMQSKMLQGQWSSAEQLGQKALLNFREWALAHNQWGLLKLQQRQFATAVAAFRRAWRLEQTPDHLANLAQALGLNGEMLEAKTCLDQLMQAEPNRIRSHSLMSLWHQAQGNAEMARRHAQMAQEFKHLEKEFEQALTPYLSEIHGCRYFLDYFTWKSPVFRQLYLGPKARFPRPQIALEIGSFEGLSANWMMRNLLQGPGAEMHSIDPWQAYGELTSAVAFLMDGGWIESHFDWNIAQAVRQTGFKHYKHKGFSGDILPGLPVARFDLIWVDGSHTASDALLDMVYAWRLLKPGGLMFCDDYHWGAERPELERPKMGVDAFLEVFTGAYTLLNQGWVVVLQKSL